MERTKAIVELTAIAFVALAAGSAWLLGLIILGLAGRQAITPMLVVFDLLWLALLVFTLAGSRRILLPIICSRIATLAA